MPATGFAIGGVARLGTCGSGFGLLGRVGARGDGGLQGLDVGGVFRARRRRLLCYLLVTVLRLVRSSEHLRGQRQGAVATQGDLAAASDFQCHRAIGAGDQLLAYENLVSLLQRTTRSIGGYRKHFADYLADDTHQSSHESFLHCTVRGRFHRHASNLNRPWHACIRMPLRKLRRVRKGLVAFAYQKASDNFLSCWPRVLLSFCGGPRPNCYKPYLASFASAFPAHTQEIRGLARSNNVRFFT